MLNTKKLLTKLLTVEEDTSATNFTMYRIGRIRFAYISKAFTLSGTLIGNVKDKDKPPYPIRCFTSIYNGSNYVTCISAINTSGEWSVSDTWGGVLSGGQTSNMAQRWLIYIV